MDELEQAERDRQREVQEVATKLVKQGLTKWEALDKAADIVRERRRYKRCCP